MRFQTLEEWLSWQESLNPKTIDLGLERVNLVLNRLGRSTRFDCPLINVAGTNGKGSVVAYLEAIALAGNRRVCCYTSPHVLDYNERIHINGKPVDDQSLCRAFERVDQARGDVELTYFEFGTLAAIELFNLAEPDLVIMEIGLGARLDAVNVMDPDVAVITTVAIDHTDWLGSNREAIGREKAGVMRAHRPLVCGDPDPPQSLLETAANLQVNLKQIGRDFRSERQNEQWYVTAADQMIDGLPLPALAGDFQLNNAATAIVALLSLQNYQLDVDAIKKGLRDVSLLGRFQIIRQKPLVIVDVAHNAEAAAALASQLKSHACSGKTHAVVAMLADKAVADVIARLRGEVGYWYTAGLESEARGLPAREMAATVERLAADVKLSAASTVADACRRACASVGQGDRIIIFGSFHTVAKAMRFFAHQQ
jgi:dihydrofolate synthase/folylpolyglutamate synthase